MTFLTEWKIFRGLRDAGLTRVAGGAGIDLGDLWGRRRLHVLGRRGLLPRSPRRTSEQRGLPRRRTRSRRGEQKQRELRSADCRQ